MRKRLCLVVLAGWVLSLASLQAGTIYQVTSKAGNKTITYEVRFGGGRLMAEYTAFDPESKQFVYLEWERKGRPPAPVMRIWDHRTGETIPLYRFPNVKNPLPLIPSIEDMKVCPLTRDRNFKAKIHILYD